MRFCLKSSLQAQVAYCKHSDLRMIKGDITFDLCMSINNVLPRQAVCAQKLKSVWAVRLQNAEAVKTLLRRGVTIQGSHIDFYPVNPFNHDNSSTERVVIKDLPFWESDSLVSDFMKTLQQITTCSDVVLSKAKNNITNGTSNFYNGDRLVFTNANFYPPPPLCLSLHKLVVIHVGSATPPKLETASDVKPDHIALMTLAVLHALNLPMTYSHSHMAFLVTFLSAPSLLVK